MKAGTKKLFYFSNELKLVESSDNKICRVLHSVRYLKWYYSNFLLKFLIQLDLAEDLNKNSGNEPLGKLNSTRGL